MIPCMLAARSPVRSCVLLLGLSLFAHGCGGGGAAGGKPSKPRVKAEGTIKYGDKPVVAGVIGFTSKDTGNSVSCQIKDGSFTCSAEEGPNPGENAVLVTGKESADGQPAWIWVSKVDIPEGGLTGKEFTVDPKSTKKPPTLTPDD